MGKTKMKKYQLVYQYTPTNSFLSFAIPQKQTEYFEDEQSKLVNMSTNHITIFPKAQLLSESWWNVFDQQFLRHDMEWTIVLVIAYMLILVIGVIANCMVILVVLLRPQMRSVTNVLVMNLAVADLCVILFCVFPTLLSNMFQRKFLNMDEVI